MILYPKPLLNNVTSAQILSNFTSISCFDALVSTGGVALLPTESRH